MTIKTEKLNNATKFPEPPMYFVEQPAALMLGSLVSRITFGVQEMDDAPFPRPVVTIAIPTPALLQLVNDIKAAFEESNFKKYAIEQLDDAARLIQTGGKLTPNIEKVDMKAKKLRLKKSDIKLNNPVE